MHRTNLRKEYLPRTVHAHVVLEAHLPPYADAEFIAWPDDVIGWYRSHVQRRKGRRHIAEQACSVDGQNLAGG